MDSDGFDARIHKMQTVGWKYCLGVGYRYWWAKGAEDSCFLWLSNRRSLFLTDVLFEGRWQTYKRALRCGMISRGRVRRKSAVL